MPEATESPGWINRATSLQELWQRRFDWVQDAARINTDASSQGGTLARAKTKSESVRKAKKMDLSWLEEPADTPLSSLLEIDTIPRAV
jgi:hypothetical protein